MRKDVLRFAKKKYFGGHSDARSVHDNFNKYLLQPFMIQLVSVIKN